MKRIQILVLLFLAASVVAAAPATATFSNPLYQGEDPWVIRHEGHYYVCTSGPVDPTAVYVSKSRTLTERGEKVKVWEDAENYRRVFAPELHFVQGKWYIYFCGDVRSEGWRHMAVVLEANTSDPLDGFTNKGVLFTGDQRGNAQANDFTVVTFNNQLYAFWGSLADKHVHGVMVAPMDSPTKITAHRKEMGLDAEGPRAILRKDKLIMTGSAGGFASKDYRLVGLMYTPANGPIDSKSSWKPLPTLLKTTSSDVWGPARASFTVSPDGTEDWVMYHSKIFHADDNGMRSVNIQKFTFNSEDIPVFGSPVGPSEGQPLPSGDPGMGEIFQAEQWEISGGVTNGASSRNYTGSGYLGGFTQQGAKAEFPVNVPEPGDYRVTLRYANGVHVAGERQSFPKIYPPGNGTLTVYVNGARIKRTHLHRTTSWDVWMFQGETLRLKAGRNVIRYQFDAGDTGNVAIDFAAVGITSRPLHGLTASYFGDRSLTDLKLTRLDPEISFNWGDGSPDPLIGADNFSCRWEGFIEPLHTETYTFHSRSDNGRRLWIVNQLVIDKWLEDWDQTYTGTIRLAAGKRYRIVYEYFESGGGANTRLEWSSPSQPREVVPSARLFPAVAP